MLFLAFEPSFLVDWRISEGFRENPANSYWAFKMDE
jgi:hypothetical protein